MTIHRREFGRTAAVVGLTAGLTRMGYFTETAAQESKSANDRIRVGVMGVNGRGKSHISAFTSLPNCEVSHVCDVDSRALAGGIAMVEKSASTKPQGFVDIRKMLEDKTFDVLSIATPNHWHAPATILGVVHGKHVYVEKPLSQTAEEGEIALAAARKHNRVVTMGNQRRSWPAIQEGIKKLHDGELGKVFYARSWYNNNRPSMGKGKPAEVPSWLNYELWQGPAPERPYKDNLIHYNWHWQWHYGGGELANNGVHGLDVARWGMQVDYPIRVSCGGGRYRFDDDQETPDTTLAAFHFAGGKSITWEGLSCSPLGILDDKFGVSFHAEKGSMAILDSGYKIFDLNNKEIAAKKGAGGDKDHFANFVDCIRSGKRPNSDVELAHQSTMLCHLGNIAYRTGRTLNTDPANGRILNDAEASKYWSREYRAGWEPKA